uniref:Uncharacterized protein n=1 Tax=Anopheles merus TaxID=30066 RepID=A0A182UX71_ANOME
MIKRKACSPGCVCVCLCVESVQDKVAAPVPCTDGPIIPSVSCHNHHCQAQIAMDTYVKNLLNGWNMPELIKVFQEEEIDEAAFKCLKYDMIKEIIPRIGKRAKFLQRYEEYKENLTERPAFAELQLDEKERFSPTSPQKPSRIDWGRIEKVCGPVPIYLKNLLKMCGYEAESSLRNLNDDDFIDMERFAREELIHLVPATQFYFHIFCSDPAREFRLVPGHRKLLLQISADEERIKKIQGCIVKLIDMWSEKQPIKLQITEEMINVTYETNGYNAFIKCPMCAVQIKVSKLPTKKGDRFVISNFSKHIIKMHFSQLSDGAGGGGGGVGGNGVGGHAGSVGSERHLSMDNVSSYYGGENSDSNTYPYDDYGSGKRPKLDEDDDEMDPVPPHLLHPYVSIKDEIIDLDA